MKARMTAVNAWFRKDFAGFLLERARSASSSVFAWCCFVGSSREDGAVFDPFLLKPKYLFCRISRQ
jgi:hypothetical protein